MALVNRDKDTTEQREVYTGTVWVSPSGVSAGIANPGVATGLTFPIATIPYPAQLIAAEDVSTGLSGTPVHSLWIYRFIVGTGFTTIPVGQTLTVSALGTSGPSGYSLFAAVTFPLLAGDVVFMYTQGSNAATASTTVTLVVKALQDIKSHFGV